MTQQPSQNAAGTTPAAAVSQPIDADKPVTVTLDRPVQWGSELVTSITIQPIRGEFLRHVDMEVEDGVWVRRTNYWLTLASLASGQPPALFDRLSYDDVMAVVGATATLARPSVGTGVKV